MHKCAEEKSQHKQAEHTLIQWEETHGKLHSFYASGAGKLHILLLLLFHLFFDIPLTHIYHRFILVFAAVMRILNCAVVFKFNCCTVVSPPHAVLLFSGLYFSMWKENPHINLRQAGHSASTLKHRRRNASERLLIKHKNKGVEIKECTNCRIDKRRARVYHRLKKYWGPLTQLQDTFIVTGSKPWDLSTLYCSHTSPRSKSP